MYSRELGDQVLTLTPSGWTYGQITRKSLFILMDKETESLWFPMKRPDGNALVAVAGPRADDVLPALTIMRKTTWDRWHLAHPTTQFVRES